MKRVFLLFLLTTCTLGASATEVTKYLEQVCQDECHKSVKIVAKKEHVQIYEQKIGDKTFPYIAYGYGYMKVKKCKKKTISYIGLLDENCKPIWGYVIPR